MELFSLGVTNEALRAIIAWKSAISLQRGPVDPKFQVEGVAPHQPLFFSENYVKWSFVWCKKICTDFSSVNHNSRVWQTDRRTDRQTLFSSVDRVCIPRRAVIIESLGVQQYTIKPGIERKSVMNLPETAEDQRREKNLGSPRSINYVMIAGHLRLSKVVDINQKILSNNLYQLKIYITFTLQ